MVALKSSFPESFKSTQKFDKILCVQSCKKCKEKMISTKDYTCKNKWSKVFDFANVDNKSPRKFALSRFFHGSFHFENMCQKLAELQSVSALPSTLQILSADRYFVDNLR